MKNDIILSSCIFEPTVKCMVLYIKMTLNAHMVIFLFFITVETGDISYRLYIIVGSSGAGLAVVLITVCLIIVIYRKMKRRKPPE